ncbi:hypothetical protein HYH02_006756 [Chlamydomonas schloesseri]|uniref:Uncharacterized protein n=1 Tax=Chlamydomonas schloesseri TaxID=2026947 RepID=A0A835WJD5_9CHLO|nr:hypothetical protein HYH02_006756 [Chlamydomonas schloesseri]|eukprot:KAG2448171.1 hypothetical protein HYH02_006756 [Chlamydomonas schloesseri]
MQRIRQCYTLEELSDVALRHAHALSPVLLVQAATQAPHTVSWPLSPSERARLHSLMGQLCGACAMRLEEYGLEQLAAVLAACVRARYTPSELLLPLQLRLKSEARGDMQEEAANVAAIATHLSRLRVGEERIWAAIDAAARACGPQVGLRHLVSLLAARIRAGVAHGGSGSSSSVGVISTENDDAAAATSWLVEQMERVAVADLHSASPQEVATLMWSLARCRRPPSRSLVRALRTHLDSRCISANTIRLQHPDSNVQAADQAATGGRGSASGGGSGGDGQRGYTVVQLAAVAGAAEKLGIVDRQLSWLLASCGAQALRGETTALRMPPPAAGTAASHRAGFAAMEAPVAPVDSKAVVVLLAGVRAVAGRPRPQTKPPATAADDVRSPAVLPPAAAAAAPPDEALAGLLRAAAEMLRTLDAVGDRVGDGSSSAELGGGRARLVRGVDAEHVAVVVAAAQEAGLTEESVGLEQLAARF